MRCAVTGSFDPITKGHVDLIKRALDMYDEVHVVVLNNDTKTYMFSLLEREEIARRTLENMDRVLVRCYSGYVIDYCKENDISVVVRGFRNAKDFAYETEMSRWNKRYGDIETLLLPQDKISYQDISSTLVRENIDNEEVLAKCLDERTINIIKEMKFYGE